ncbi:hypothetical protein PN462_10610 [Spirulina sp. CS-785/01]|uniref:hypothetical protein n=1 Tax=Spirulina sp. CS-785/01 TaxID=3021716 RepID=UPI0023301FAF|nr:hypothetical protein [Spirulina sp. CS-785/01]MDB9313551.1 hypothetical protein [Spirulina sp. CS-785/01]
MFWNKSSDNQKNQTEQLALRLQKAGFKTQYKPASPDDSIESVIVTLPSEKQQFASFIKLSFASTAYQAMKKMGDPDLESNQNVFGDFDHLQFYAPLQIELNANSINEVALVNEKLNGNLPLLGFNLEQFQEAKLTFRYLMLIEKDKVNLKLVQRSIDLIYFLISEYAPIIETIATGQKKVADLDF